MSAQCPDCRGTGHFLPPADPEPHPGDGPDYHAEHQAWRERQARVLPTVNGGAS